MPENESIQQLSLLYKENAKIAAIFWEWRNKIITYFFSAIGALFFLSSWLYQQSPGRLISIPLFLGAFLSLASYYLDKRNGEILQRCYQCGKDLEQRILRSIEDSSPSKEQGIFEMIGKAHLKKGGSTYSKTLRVVYTSMAVFLVVLALANLVFPLGRI